MLTYAGLIYVLTCYDEQHYTYLVISLLHLRVGTIDFTLGNLFS